jgi:transposase
MDATLDFELPDDIDALKALVRAQAEAHQQLIEQREAALREAKRQGETLSAERKAYDTRIEALQGQIRLLLARRFGASAETVSVAQLQLFNEAEAEAQSVDAEDETAEPDGMEVKAHVRRRPVREALPEDLPRVDVHHELPEDERLCERHGVALERFGEEVSEQIDIIPATFQVLRHVRGKYRCPCCTGGIQTAPLPPQPIPKSIASPGTLAYVAAGKFVLGQPLYRQQKELERLSFKLSRATLATWMIRAGELVQPLVNLIREHLLEAPYLQMDETTVQVLKEAGKAAETKSYLWVQMNPGAETPAVLFDYDPTRSSAVPVRLLEGFTGALHVDGYRGYDAVVDMADLTRLYCMAHARRKFVELIKRAGFNPKKLPNPPPPEVRAAYQAINIMKTLFVIERRIQGRPPDERYAVRQSESVPVLETLREWMEKTLRRVPPTSHLGQAVRYLHNHWSGLIVYVQNGHYEISTNAVEGAIRPFAMGRRVWLFSDTVAGAKSSANLYSVVETAKLNGLQPYAYLRHLFTWLPRAQSVEDIEALLPWRTDAEHIKTAYR